MADLLMDLESTHLHGSFMTNVNDTIQTKTWKLNLN